MRYWRALRTCLDAWVKVALLAHLSKPGLYDPSHDLPFQAVFVCLKWLTAADGLVGVSNTKSCQLSPRSYFVTNSTAADSASFTVLNLSPSVSTGAPTSSCVLCAQGACRIG